MMTTLYSVNLMPIDPILFGDNRSSRAGDDHMIRDQDPSPHTIYGAIGSNIISMFGAKNTERHWETVKNVLGDFQPDIASGSPNRSELLGYHFMDTNRHSLFPLPKHVRLIAPPGNDPVIGESMVLQKLDTELAACSLSEFPEFFAFEPEEHEDEIDIHISSKLLEALLCGKDCRGHILKPENNCFARDSLFKEEVRRGLGMDYKRNTTCEGILFSRPYRRFFSDLHLDSGEWRAVSIQAYFKTLNPLNTDVIAKKKIAFLGGDRGRAFIEFVPLQRNAPLAELLQSVQQVVSGTSGFFIYLLTPAVRENDWPAIDNQPPIAAAIGKAVSISGWNTDPNNQHPRPMLRLIPAGSTFFYRWPTSFNDDQKKELLAKYWMEPVTRGNTENFRNSGFGRILTGVW